MEREEIKRMRRNVSTCRSPGRTFDNELYFTRSTWESQSVPEIEQRSHENSRFQRRLPSTFVVLATFIDSKSVADLRSRISVEMLEERCHFIRRDCRCYMPHRKICRRRRLDWQISQRCLSQYHMKCYREANCMQVDEIYNYRIKS